MGNKMYQKSCKKRGNLDPEPGEIKDIKKPAKHHHPLEEDKKDNDVIPKQIYQRVRRGKQILTNAEQLFKSEKYKFAYDAYKQGCSQILDVAEIKGIPKFYRDQLRDITQISMKKVHTCKQILKLMSPSSSVSSASPPSTSSLAISDAQKKAIYQQKKRKEQILRSIDAKHQQSIQQNILDNSIGVKFSDICGQLQAKEVIKNQIIQPMMRPDLYKGILAPSKGILLYGPPGNGKTMLAKAVASQVNAKFFNISASALMSRWLGEGEKLVRALFAVASAHQPSIIFVDEIDSILTARSQNQHQASRRLKTQFFLQVDGCTSSSLGQNVIVIGATNRPHELDEAAMRRFGRKILIDVPNLEERKEVILRHLKGEKFKITEINLTRIATMSEGYSNADLKNLTKQAAMRVMNQIPSQKLLTINKSDIRAIQIKDFEYALQKIKPSVKKETIFFLRKFGLKK